MSDEKTERIYIRVTTTEKEFIVKKAKEYDMTITDFLVSLAIKKNVIVATDLPKITIELSRIGNNINQIATVCNTQKYINKQLADILLKKQDVIYKVLADYYNLIFSQLEEYEPTVKREKDLLEIKKSIANIRIDLDKLTSHIINDVES